MSGTGWSVVVWILLLLVLVLGALLSIQLSQRRQLRRWIENPEQGDPPDGMGAWRAIFSRLQQLRKEERAQRSILENSRDRFRRAVETLPDGVILLDREGHIEWLNAEAARHFDLDIRRDVGTLIVQLIRQGEFIAYLNDFLAGASREPLVLSRNNEHLPQVLSLLLLSFSSTELLLLSRDITEIARAETTRRDFIANVSHELRTPLTVISGFLEQLTGTDAPSGETAQKFLRLMDDQARRMARLVEDLLTLSRLENATEPPREEPVDMAALIESLLCEARALSGGRHVIEAGTVVPAKVLLGSGDELRSAFGNLLTNAIRYTPDGGRITLSWYEEGEQMVFSVSDTGIGIPVEHIPRLAERFYRVDKGRSTATGGTGLGLAIVKHVLARHGGTLQIASVQGRGSTFSARLPVARLLR